MELSPEPINREEEQVAVEISKQTQQTLQGVLGYEFQQIRTEYLNHFQMVPLIPHPEALKSGYGFKVHLAPDYKSPNFQDIILKLVDLITSTKCTWKVMNPIATYYEKRDGMSPNKQIVIYPNYLKIDTKLEANFNLTATEFMIERLKDLIKAFPELIDTNIPADIMLSPGIFAGFGGSGMYLAGDNPTGPFWDSLSTIAIDMDQKQHVIDLAKRYGVQPPENWENKHKWLF